MARGATQIPLLADAARIYLTSESQVQQQMVEAASRCIVHFPGIGSHRMANSTLYEHDFFTWTQTTAALLRAGNVQDIDVHILAEEIESMGKRDRRALGSQLQRLVMHLLKWAYQSARRQEGHSWYDSIADAREEIQDLLDDNPHFREQLLALLVQRYPRARRRALRETRLPETTLPQTCPWTVEQILQDDFFPEASNA